MKKNKNETNKGLIKESISSLLLDTFPDMVSGNNQKEKFENLKNTYAEVYSPGIVRVFMDSDDYPPSWKYFLKNEYKK